MLILQIGLQRYFFFFTNQLFGRIFFTSYLKISLPSANNKSPLRTKQGAGPSCPAPRMTVGANRTMSTDGLPFGLCPLAFLAFQQTLRSLKSLGSASALGSLRGYGLLKRYRQQAAHSCFSAALQRGGASRACRHRRGGSRQGALCLGCRSGLLPRGRSR